MLVHHVKYPNDVDVALTFGASGNPEDLECDFSAGGCVIERNQVIIDIDRGSWARLNRQQTIELAKFLLSCAAVMEDE